MKSIYWLSLVLVLVGAINWGLVGLFQFDLVAFLFGGSTTVLARVVYTLVGASAVALAGTVIATANGRHAAIPR